MIARRRITRKPHHLRYELDFWTRLANHLAHFPHPEPALTCKTLIAAVIVRSASRRLSRRGFTPAPPLPHPYPTRT